MPRRRLVPIAMVVVALVAVPAAWARATAPGPVEDPRLPSVAEEVDGLYDEDGCMRTGAETVDCSVRATEVDEALAEGVAGGPRHLEGFVGPLWDDHAGTGGVRVLEETVAMVPSPGGVALTGLARNEGDRAVAEVTVEVRLHGEDGGELAVATGASPVGHVRPGEPVPFVVEAPVAADLVGSLAWTAAGIGAGDADRRALAWRPYWERPAGGEPVDIYLHRDIGGDRPHLVFGAVDHVGDVTVGDPRVLVAWRDGDGRLVGWAEAPLRTPSGEPLATLSADGSADALVVVADTLRAEGESMVWVWGR